MNPIPIPEREEERLSAVATLLAGSWTNDSELEDLTEVAAQICGTPMALITFIEKDRQRLRTRVGLPGEIRETPRSVAFCAHAIAQPDVMVIRDLQQDERFAENPMVQGDPHIRFYAGAPLNTSDGLPLGTICVMDHVPRELTAQQRRSLSVLSRHVVALLELRHSNECRARAEAELQAVNAELERRVDERTEALREAGERLELAIRASNIGLWEWDPVFGEMYQSPEWKAQLGYSDEEMPSVGHEWRKLIHPEDNDRVVETMREFLKNPEGEYEIEARFMHKDGKYRWVLSRARMHFGPDGQPARMLGCHIDLTERRQHEEELERLGGELRALAAHLDTVREEEAERMSRELHDELGATLTGLKFDVAWLDRQLERRLPGKDGELLRERVRALNANLDATIESVRKVCRQLRPAILGELGLAEALEWQASDFSSRTGLPCEVSRPEQIDVEPARATVIFRVLQELLTNVARHARADQACVKIEQMDGHVRLEVRDDGCGLPKDASSRPDRFGLVGVRERVLACGGTVEFESVTGRGTKVTVQLPGYPKENAA